MILKLYSVKDSKVAFYPPFAQTNDAVALRNAKNALNESSSNIFNTDTEDKQLWFIGEFDDDTGVVSGNPRFMVNLIDFVEVSK